MIKAGVSTASLYPMVTENALYELAVRQVRCVEIFFNSHCEIENPFVNNLKNIISEYGMTVSSIHPYTCGIEPMMFFTQYPRRFLDILDYYKKYFEIMNILGAEIFVFHGNKPQNSFPEDMYFERFKGLYETGKQFGITVAQENVARCSSGDIGFIKRMSHALGDDAKFVFDTKQAVRKGYDPYDFLDVIKDKLVHIHISDYDSESDCKLVGKGSLDLIKFNNKLKDCCFTGSIILELYSNGYNKIDDLAENYGFIKSVVENNC